MELIRLNVIDNHKLLPDQTILIEAIQHHPLSTRLLDVISEILIIDDKEESIEYDFISGQVILHLSDYSFKKENIKYILYHEFTHIADKINPTFEYSEKLKETLTETEKLLVMEIWNVYIDARLNMHGLFQLGDVDKNIRSSVNGKVQTLPYTIEGKLLRHTGFMKSRGFRNSKDLITNIWTRQLPDMSYPGIVKLVRTMSG